MSFALNLEQHKAVTHSGSPLLIVAGPGSGKTRVIVERILYLVSRGLKPSEVLCLTFSEKAAEEMKQRLEKTIDISEMQISTFHSFAKDLLEDNVLVSGIGMSSGVMSRASQLVWGLKNIDTFDLQYIELGYNTAEIIESIIDGISTFKDELVGYQELASYLGKKLEQILDDEQRSFFLKLADMAKVYEKYQKFQRSRAIIDFDDMIVETVKLLRRRPDIARKYQDKFKHIFVDEFQDNNFAQLELVKLISKDGNVTAVGDDDQCIYRFQGAYLTNFKDFSAFFKNTTTINLNQNYRSSQNIVKLANQLLEGVPERQAKKLFSENEEGDKVHMTICSNENSEVEFVVKTIKNLIGKHIRRRNGTDEILTYKDFVILARKKILGEKFAKGLKAHGIPVIFVGESNLFAIPFVKDFMCFLKIANSPGKSGMEMTRLMTLSGITEQNIAEINRLSKKKAYNDPTDIDFVFETLKDYSNLDVSQKHTLKEFLTQIENLIRHCNTSSLSEFVYKVIMSISGLYKQAIISNTPENRRIRLILKELHRIAMEFESLNPHGSLNEFISHLTLMGEFDIELEEGFEFDDAVRVTTIHKSKGKEYPVVFVVDVAVNKLPLRYQAKKFYVPSELSKGVKITEDEKGLYIQEERRLLYVSMTRAQNLLFISYAKQYEENKRESKPSRFLEELDFDKNQLISVEHFTSEETESENLLFEENRIERLKNDLQIKATQSIFQMNLKTAMDRIFELAKLKYFEENNSLEGFDPIECSKVDYDHDTLDNQLKDVHVPLISKEELVLSASKLDTYNICPLKFKFAHVLQIPSAPKSAMHIGTSVHAVAEHITQLEIDGVNITEETAFEILDKEWIISSFNSETEANQAKEKAREMLKTYLKWKSANPNKVVAAEQKFTIEIGEIPINGSIDRIERTLEGDYEVIDFKTGGVKETKTSIKDDIQMNVYALATEKLYGILPKNTFLFYLKKNKTVMNKVESSHVEKVKKSMESMVNSILREEFNATPSFEVCRNCDYQTICDSKKIR